MTPDLSLLGVALVLCVAGVWERVAWKRRSAEDRRWVEAAVRTEGVVSRLVDRKDHSGPRDSNDNIAIHEVPVVRFRAASGQEYEIDGPNGMKGEIGRKVPVAYNPDLPSDACVLLPAAYRGGCGFILIAIGLALALKAIVAGS